MKNRVLTSLILALLILTSGTTPTSAATEYKLLAPLGSVTSVRTDTNSGFSDYLQKIVDVSIAITAAISVLMLIFGGLEYIFSSVNEKSKNDAKERMTNAILGVLIVLAGYLILRTVDPKLLKLTLPTLPAQQPYNPNI